MGENIGTMKEDEIQERGLGPEVKTENQDQERRSKTRRDQDHGRRSRPGEKRRTRKGA